MSASEAQLRERLRREGLRPIRWSNGPDAVYGEHEHPYGKILVVASGSLALTIHPGAKRVVSMKRGDRVELPPHTLHSAVVGADGVVCFEAHIRPKK